MLAYIVTGIVLLALSIALITGMWKASKFLVIPMQILIFIVLIFIVVKIFLTQTNIKNLNSEIENSGIVDSQRKAAQSLLAPTVSQPSPAVQAAPAEEAAQPTKTPAPQPQPPKQIDPIDLM